MVGVLTLYHAETDAFTSDHLRILLAISSKMALAIENALKYEQAESSATTDYLTDLPNARSLFLQLDRELARCKRDNSTLIVMVSDMDGFKQINDRFGHLEGNRVLRLFAQALKESCREYDYVARMGGDEFVVVAPGLTLEAAAKKPVTKCVMKRSFRLAWVKLSIPMTEKTRRHCWPKPTVVCTSKSRNSPRGKTAASIRG